MFDMQQLFNTQSIFHIVVNTTNNLKRCLKKGHKKCAPGVVESRRASLKSPIISQEKVEPEFHSFRAKLRPVSTSYAISPLKQIRNTDGSSSSDVVQRSNSGNFEETISEHGISLNKSGSFEVTESSTVHDSDRINSVDVAPSINKNGESERSKEPSEIDNNIQIEEHEKIVEIVKVAINNQIESSDTNERMKEEIVNIEKGEIRDNIIKEENKAERTSEVKNEEVIEELENRDKKKHHGDLFTLRQSAKDLDASLETLLFSTLNINNMKNDNDSDTNNNNNNNGTNKHQNEVVVTENANEMYNNNNINENDKIDKEKTIEIEATISNKSRKNEKEEKIRRLTESAPEYPVNNNKIQREEISRSEGQNTKETKKRKKKKKEKDNEEEKSELKKDKDAELKEKEITTNVLRRSLSSGPNTNEMMNVEAKNLLRMNIMKQHVQGHDLLKQDRRRTLADTYTLSNSTDNSNSNNSNSSNNNVGTNITNNQPKINGSNDKLSKSEIISRQKAATVSTVMSNSGSNSSNSNSGKDNGKQNAQYIKEIQMALARGELKEVRKKINKIMSKSNSRNILMNEKDEIGQTILHLVVENNLIDIVKLLIDKKIEMNSKDERGMTPLSIACLRGNEEIINILINKEGILPDITSLIYYCGYCCSNKSEQIIKIMIDKGVDINASTPHSTTGDTPLHTAIRNNKELNKESLVGSVLMVELLLKFGANVNIKNNRMDTPLHWAVYTDKSRVAKLLIISGADLHSKGHEGLSPLQLALQKPNSNVAQCLRKINEMIILLKPLDFHTEEPYSYVINKFIEEEIGEIAFKGITTDLFHRMGIKNPANLAVLLATQETLKQDSINNYNSNNNNNNNNYNSNNKSTATSPTETARSQYANSGSHNIYNSNGSNTSNNNTNNIEGLIVPITQNIKSIEEWITIIPNGIEFIDNNNNNNNNNNEIESSSGKKRLNTRIEEYKLKVTAIQNYPNIEMEKNSIYIIAAIQLFDTIDCFIEIRQSVGNWMNKNKNFKYDNKNNNNISSNIQNCSWSKYCASIINNECWGDGNQLIGISEVYGCKIQIISSNIGNNFIITIIPTTIKTNKTITMAHLQPLYFSPLESINSFNFQSLLDLKDEINTIEYKDIKLIKPISHGSTSEIYEGDWKGVKVAVKKMELNGISKEEYLNIQSEISLLKKLRHPNIINFLASCFNNNNNELYILTEYMPFGNLTNLIEKSELDWKLKLTIAIDIANGMNYLHTLKPYPLVHRDLKTSNILVDRSFNVKIADFGVAKKYEKTLISYCSTPRWTSPEQFMSENYTEKVDVYSYGLILWSLLTNKQPFHDYSDQQIILGVGQGTLRPPIPKLNDNNNYVQYIDLMKDCWQRDSKNRPTFEDIIVVLKNIKDELQIQTTEYDATKLVTNNKYNMNVTNNNKLQEVVKNEEGQTPYWSIDYKELKYNTTDIIGQGKFANVYKGTYVNQPVAIKVLKEIPEDGAFEKELEVLSRVRTPSLIFFYGACLSPKCCIVTELMTRGTLYDYMQQSQLNISWLDVIKLTQQIALGISYLHAWKPPLVHRDIKSSNLLLDKDNSIKICDLGLARFNTKSNDLTLRKCKGTPVFIAPESYLSALEIAEEEKSQKLGSELNSVMQDMKEKNSNLVGWTTKSDVFSFSVVIWELATRCFYGVYRTPYYSDYKHLKFDAAILIQVAKKGIYIYNFIKNKLKIGLRPIIRKEIPDPIKFLITKCWDQTPTNRPDFETILPMLKEIEDDYNKHKQIWEKCYIHQVVK